MTQSRRMSVVSAPVRANKGPQLTVLVLLFLSTNAVSHAAEDPWRARFKVCQAAFEKRDLDVAEVRCKEALEVARAESPPGLRTAVSLNSLGAVYIEQDRVAEARQPFYDSLRIFERVAAEPNQYFVGLLTNIGDLERRQGNWAKSEQMFRRAAQLAEQLIPPVPALAERSRSGVVEALSHQIGEVQRADTPQTRQCCEALPRCPENTTVAAYKVEGGFNVRCESSEHVADGPMAVCDTAGTLLAVVTFNKGVKDGLFTTYYPSGKKKVEREFAGDVPDGLTTEYYESGRVSGRAFYQKGEKTGLQTDYYESGVKRAEANFVSGVQVGHAVSFYANGHKESEGNFRDGKPDGEWTRWSEDGLSESRVVFRDGVEVQRTGKKSE